MHSLLTQHRTLFVQAGRGLDSHIIVICVCVCVVLGGGRGKSTVPIHLSVKDDMTILGLVPLQLRCDWSCNLLVT